MKVTVHMAEAQALVPGARCKIVLQRYSLRAWRFFHGEAPQTVHVPLLIQHCCSIRSIKRQLSGQTYPLSLRQKEVNYGYYGVELISPRKCK